MSLVYDEYPAADDDKEVSCRVCGYDLIEAFCSRCDLEKTAQEQQQLLQ